MAVAANKFLVSEAVTLYLCHLYHHVQHQASDGYNAQQAPH